MATAPTTNATEAKTLPLPSPLDLRLASRTAATAALLAAAALLVMSRTDEPTSTWADRGARLGALAPALGAVAASLHAGQLRRRGEALALQLVGAPPWRLALGAAAGGALVGALGGAASALLSPSLRALLPVAASSPWHLAAAGFEAPALGLALQAPGASLQFLAAAPGAPPGPPRAAIAAALALGALLASGWAAMPSPPRARLLVGAAATLAAVASFHALALGHTPALLLLPSLLLAAHLAALTRPR